MKFSYTLLKQFVPELKNKAQTMELLSLYACEAEDAGGNTIEIKIPANRWSDLGSHRGIARELATILKKKSQIPPVGFGKKKPLKKSKFFDVEVKEKNLCGRYAGAYVSGVCIGESPAWMKKVLTECGLRPINNVVDIMNYVMIETGQPLHAFDYEKIEGKSIVVRYAKKNEHFESIDGKQYELPDSALVIADKGISLAIAGIKGGKDAEVSRQTKTIIVEAANFNPVSIMKTSRQIKLATDASQRFSHDTSSVLVEWGISRACQLLKEYAKASIGDIVDIESEKRKTKLIVFTKKKYEAYTGASLEMKRALDILSRIGFIIKKKNQESCTLEIPQERTDIESEADIIEEILRFEGYGQVLSQAPKIALTPGVESDLVVTKEKARDMLEGFGLHEIYSYTFLGEKDKDVLGIDCIELTNPMSNEIKYIRPSLERGIIKALEEGMKYTDEGKLFEIGNVFQSAGKGINEKTHIAIGIASKKREPFFEMKGIVEKLLLGLGVQDFSFHYTEDMHDEMKMFLGKREAGHIKRFEIEDGINAAFCEVNIKYILEDAKEEYFYKPLPKYPAVIRDITVPISYKTKIGDVVQSIETSDKLIIDVDFVDEYIPKRTNEKKRSVTFRIVFQDASRTLTKEEVDEIMKGIEKNLEEKFL